MKRVAFVSIIAVATGSFSLWEFTHSFPPMPRPSEGEPGEDAQFAQRRQAWIESLHLHAPGIDWRAADAQSRERLAAQRQQARDATISAQALTGTWRERGANNQAGRVSAVDYDAATDRITVFAHGGQLWRTQRSPLAWKSLNDMRHFESYYQ